MARVHTAHGIGKIIQTETTRGRTSHLVEGAGFRAWVPATQCRTARDIKEDNSTTLPYDPTPQYPADMWSSQATILPGDQEIDAEERLSPSDSLDFDSRRESIFPEPSPALFATAAARRTAGTSTPSVGEGGASFSEIGPSVQAGSPSASIPGAVGKAVWNGSTMTGQESTPAFNPGPRTTTAGYQVGPWTADDWEAAENFDPTDEYRGHPDSWSHEPTEEDYAAWDRAHGKRRADLDPKYASWILEAEQGTDDSVSRFARDPQAEIQRLAHLWHGNAHDESIEEYGRLVEADRMLREAAWADVRRKAQRLRREGKLTVKYSTPTSINAIVEGDHGVYHTLIKTSSPGQTIDQYVCSCKWGQWAYRRRTFVGRTCSHGYAAYLELKSNAQKDNKGRFRRSPYQRAASITDDFQDYVDEYRDGHVDQDAATHFMDLHEVDADQANALYDYVEDNHAERTERTFDSPPGCPEGLLRTSPATLTPSLFRVPSPGEPYTVDVEADERTTTAPDNIMSEKDWKTAATHIDALGNPYRPMSLIRTADEALAAEADTVDDDDQTQPATGATTETAPAEDGSVDTTTPAAPAAPEDNGSWRGNGFDPSMIGGIVGPIAQGVGTVVDSLAGAGGLGGGGLASGVASGVSSLVSGIGSGLGGFFASRTTDEAQTPEEHFRLRSHDDPDYDSYKDHQKDLGEDPEWNHLLRASRTAAELDDLRDITDMDPPLGHMDEYNDEIRDIVDELREYGADASPIVARRRTSADDFLIPSGHDSANGSGPRDRDWYTTSEDAIELFDVDGSHTDEEVDGPGTPTNPRAAANGFGGAGDQDPELSELMAEIADGVSEGEEPNDYLFDSMGRYHRNRFKQAWKDGDPDDPRTECGLPSRGKGESDRNFAENLGGPDPEKARMMVIMETEEPLQRAASAGDHSDIVRRFHASGAAEAIRGSSSGQTDDDIATRARGFLAKTAGRVYSLAEQQELIDEPGTARNKPTKEDLIGTHYVGD